LKKSLYLCTVKQKLLTPKKINNMRTFEKEMNVSQIKSFLTAAAAHWASFFDCQWIENDMKKSIEEWLEYYATDGCNIYGEHWFAIREQGVESGCKETVKLRLLQLGKPVQVIKVVGHQNELATVKMKLGE